MYPCPRLKSPNERKGTKSLKVPASPRPPSPYIPQLNSSPQPLAGTDSSEEGLTAQPAHQGKGRACGPRGGPRKFKTSPQRCRPASLCLPGSLPFVPALPPRDPAAHLSPEPQDLSLSPRRRRTPKHR